MVMIEVEELKKEMKKKKKRIRILRIERRRLRKRRRLDGWRRSILKFRIGLRRKERRGKRLWRRKGWILRLKRRGWIIEKRIGWEWIKIRKIRRKRRELNWINEIEKDIEDLLNIIGCRKKDGNNGRSKDEE